MRLDAPGVPLFLQFKRSECMRTRGAKEISKHKLSLNSPFYRFRVTERRRSLQHELLLELEAAPSIQRTRRFKRPPLLCVALSCAWHSNCKPLKRHRVTSQVDTPSFGRAQPSVARSRSGLGQEAWLDIVLAKRNPTLLSRRCVSRGNRPSEGGRFSCGRPKLPRTTR